MRLNTPFVKYGIALLCIAVVPVSCFKNLTEVDVVYQNDFEDNQVAPLEVVEWNSTTMGLAPVSDVRITGFNGTRELGKINNGYVQLTVHNLPQHQFLRTEFDLYIHDNWRNDLWRFEVDGVWQLLTGFSNDKNTMQSYPNWLGNGSALSPAGKNAIDVDLPGCSLVSSSFGTSRYRIAYTTPHTTNTVILVWGDAGNFLNDTCKRSWGIDNIKVRTLKN